MVKQSGPVSVRKKCRSELWVGITIGLVLLGLRVKNSIMHEMDKRKLGAQIREEPFQHHYVLSVLQYVVMVVVV